MRGYLEAGAAQGRMPGCGGGEDVLGGVAAGGLRIFDPQGAAGFRGQKEDEPGAAGDYRRGEPGFRRVLPHGAHGRGTGVLRVHGEGILDELDARQRRGVLEKVAAGYGDMGGMDVDGNGFLRKGDDVLRINEGNGQRAQGDGGEQLFGA